ncbi:MAG: type II toxin-antitoxin system RelE/ParE family toxin [Desulfobulbaceae bacterium]|nr:type II toxin-antitoxin system RelE/ParE family toxin [Desulfobulbaceae bacterium]
MTSLIFDPGARHEFLEAVSYYEKCSVGLGKRFRDDVESASKSIVETPFRYRILSAPFRGCLISKFPYAIIYTIEPDHIRIITFFLEAIGWDDFLPSRHLAAVKSFQKKSKFR